MSFSSILNKENFAVELMRSLPKSIKIIMSAGKKNPERRRVVQIRDSILRKEKKDSAIVSD